MPAATGQSEPVLEDQLDADDRRVFDLAFELLGQGPRSVEDLVALIGDQGAFAYLEGFDDDQLAAELIDILTTTDRFWTAEQPLVVRVDLLLEGVVLTHRLTPTEVERGGIELEPNLGVIDFDLDHETDRVVDGRTAEVAMDLREGWFAWVLADGLPAGSQAGDLVGIRRQGAAFELLHGADLEAAVGAVDTGPLLEALRAALDEIRTTGVGVESTDVLMGLLCSAPDVFRSPAPPLSELLAEAGASRRGDYFGPADVEWQLPGERYLAAERKRRLDRWEFGPCCEEAFDVVDRAWGNEVLGLDPEREPAEIRTALAHNAVSLAMLEHWDEQAADPDELVSFLEPLVAKGRRDTAPTLFLLATALDRSGRVLDAERRYEEATLADRDFIPPWQALGLMAFERGDLARAVMLLDRAEEPGRRHPVSELIEDIAPPVEGVGRNDPCPCGSGRKFKACHLGKPLGGGAGGARLLLHKALFHLHQRDREALEWLAEPYGAGAEELMEDDFVADVALFEGGSFAEFLEERAPLLPAEDVAEGEVWLATPRRLYEVLEVEPGQSLVLLDLTTGRRLDVDDKLGSLDRQVGDYLLARVVRPEAAPAIVGAGIVVPMRSRETVLAILDEGADPDDLVHWLVTVTAPPQLQNRTGEDLVLCELAVDSGLDGFDEVAAALDGCLGAEARDADEATTWRWSVPVPDGVPDERLIAGQVEVDGRRLTCTTNSEERADELIAMLRSAMPDLSVESDVRIPADELPLGEGDGSGLVDPADAPPEVQEALREYQRQYEEAWIDMAIPALDGMTPRAAMDDPTRREDVERLLADMAPDSGDFGMDPARIRELLGLTDG